MENLLKEENKLIGYEDNFIAYKIPCFECLYDINKIETENDFIKNKKGVYALFTEDKKLIYIGKSKELSGRLYKHFHSPIRKYSSSLDKKRTLQKREITKFFSFIEVDDFHLDIVEVYLIKKYKPILNKQYK